MQRREWIWVGVAAAALGVGGAVSMWIRTPSFGVKAQLQIDRWAEELAGVAGKNDGVFPPDRGACRAALTLSEESFQDPWGRQYQYENVAPTGPFRLWSVGADGRDDRGDGDDIASWTR